MAKYTITHTCGHDEEVQIYGPEKERPGKAAWMAKQPCVACKREAQASVASVQAVGLGLVDLQGSEKQIAWAKTIRQEFVTAFERRFSGAQGSADESARAMKAFIAVLNAHPDARFWIDHRGESVRLFAKEYEAEYAKK
jgi:hypothetical protein